MNINFINEMSKKNIEELQNMIDKKSFSGEELKKFNDCKEILKNYLIFLEKTFQMILDWD